jgi:dipeptidyl aminopeptidase/acylaminoacyl peptidase
MKTKIFRLFVLFTFTALTAAAQAPRKPIGNLLVENIPDLPADLTERWEQYQNIRSASFADWNAKGDGIYISTRFGDVAQIHHVAKAGGAREQVTFYKEPVSFVRTCPDPTKDGFLFSRDKGGNENFQIYNFDRKNGKVTLLTDGTSRNGNYRWNKKGDKVFYTSTKRTGKDVDFYVAPLSNPEAATMILENKGGGWGMVDWSADESRMLVRNGISANESKIYMYDLMLKKLEPINPSEKQISYSGMEFSKDGKGIYILSDEDSEFAGLRYYDFTTKKQSKIVEMNWDIESFEQSEDGSVMAFSVNEGGYYKVYVLDKKTMKHTPLSILPKGVVGNFSFNKDNQRLAVSITTPTSSSDVYVVNVKTNKMERWTTSEIGGLNAANFTECSLIEFPTYDKDEKGKQRMIPSLLYMPKNAKGKIPVVIDIHGGPEGQSYPSFSNWRQFLVNELGIAVLVPNVRGSSGYGKTYLKLDNGMLRENSVKDIGLLLDWVEKQPNLDAARVAVFGGSYGGYMSLACMTNYNARFKCGIDLFGISNFVTFLKNTSGYRVDLRRVEYGDEREPAMAAHLEKISPLTNIKNITKPMFIYQGENDPRVPLNESEQMLEALKKGGVSSWYVRAKDEGHGIAKKANRDYTYAAIALFLKMNL